MKNEIKEILDKIKNVANRETASRNALMEMTNEDYQLLLDYITNLQCDVDSYKTKYNNAKNNLKEIQKDYDKAMKLVDKGVENSYIKIKEQKKEIEKLTAESTEWESKCYDLQEENERLKEQNNELRKIYRNTYQRLFDNGNDELASYFQAQIGDCPTFYVEPIIDYYKEWKDYKSRNEKAIEYIKITSFFNKSHYDFKNDLLNILQGEDNK